MGPTGVAGSLSFPWVQGAQKNTEENFDRLVIVIGLRETCNAANQEYLC